MKKWLAICLVLLLAGGMLAWWYPKQMEPTEPTGEILERQILTDGEYWELWTSGLYLYEGSRLREAWRCEVDDYDYYTTFHAADWADPLQHMYLYTGTQLLSVEENGRLEVIVDRAVVPYFYFYEDETVGAYYLDGDAMKLYCDQAGEVSTTTVVPAGVLGATGYGAPFVELDDGLTYCFDGWNDDMTAKLVALGPKTPEQYRMAFRDVGRTVTFAEFVAQCQAEWESEERT